MGRWKCPGRRVINGEGPEVLGVLKEPPKQSARPEFPSAP